MYRVINNKSYRHTGFILQPNERQHLIAGPLKVVADFAFSVKYFVAVYINIRPTGAVADPGGFFGGFRAF
ncbi:MAG TPA: hypothetical protein DEB31_04455 [Clostridiales bacterium]|nr:hypothetical protein [Clostridiales bacterium]